MRTFHFEDIQREEEKVKRSIKDAGKKGQKDVCIILAKEMIQSKKAINKLYASKAQMNSVLLSMKNQLCKYGLYFYFHCIIFKHKTQPFD